MKMTYKIAFECGYDAGYATTSRNLKPRIVPLDFVSNYDSEMHDEWLAGYDAGKKDFEKDCRD
jgi:hypothetical protein